MTHQEWCASRVEYYEYEVKMLRRQLEQAEQILQKMKEGAGIAS